MRRPYESDVPAPTNWRVFLPTEAVTTMLNDWKTLFVGMIVLMMTLFQTISPRQLSRATLGLQAYLRLKVNLLD